MNFIALISKIQDYSSNNG